MKLKEAHAKTGIRARAYCSSANLGPGFDVFGLALDAFYDEVSIIPKKHNSGSGLISITNRTETDGQSSPHPPTDPDTNTAGVVVKAMMEVHGITDDLDMVITKGVPVGRGLGSSAASAAAAAVAFDRLYDLRYTREKMVTAAGRGEMASAGTVHYDNVAASVAGGFVIVRPSDPVVVAKFKPDADLRFCVAIPDIRVPDKKTEVSRKAIPKKIALDICTQNLANATLLAAALVSKDNSLLGSGITADAIAEPARKIMMPGFEFARQTALGAGAREVMISGAGPSVIAVIADKRITIQRRVAEAMAAGFKKADIRCTTILCRPAGGARVR